MKPKHRNNQTLKIICRRVEEALKHKKTSVAISNLVMNRTGITHFKVFVAPLLIAGGFRIKYADIYRRKQTYVVLMWDKNLIS